ncbi:hypothetical protein [Legionella hackeliae]|uniref:Uncharacterized protein n=1 Tax=Legionella hackeliae TaxID=449 RepID=A0A0A8US83_LEGHA|nr:hypothetical protein [Legionella hackeliae]KTD10454.1 hypothetical protein Lhac_2822 [Legionella hackeliae]CEK09957.1 protein of unknown function [Legionella hackeliae]STX49870.1 Uncharacterised protein [Legionella hackeliae]
MNEKLIEQIKLFIAKYKSKSTENFEEQFKLFCKENNLILVKPKQDISSFDLLQGQILFLEAQDFKDTELKKAHDAAREALGQSFDNPNDTKAKDASQKALEVLCLAKKKYLNLLHQGTSFYNFRCQLHYLFNKNLDEADDIDIPNLLHRLAIAKKDIESFQTRFPNEANLFSAFLFSFFAQSLKDKMESFDSFSSKIDTSKESAIPNKIAKDFIFFQTSQLNQVRRICPEEIQYCMENAQKCFSQFNNTMSKEIIEFFALDLFHSNSLAVEDKPGTADSACNFLISCINQLNENYSEVGKEELAPF